MMLVIARTTVMQVVVMNGNGNTRVMIVSWYERENRKCLELLSENREWRRRCDVERQVVPDGGTRNRKRQLTDYRETNGRNFQTMWGRRPQPSCRVGNTGETRL